jgi:hypothetical protein
MNDDVSDKDAKFQRKFMGSAQICIPLIASMKKQNLRRSMLRTSWNQNKIKMSQKIDIY